MNSDVLANLDFKLKGSGHDTWGWVIYRCTYSSDNDWSEFMKELKTTSRRMLDGYGATEAMVKRQAWTIIEDRERLENASKSDVRRMFNDWVHSPEAAVEQPNAKGHPPAVHLSRYLYCMHVDEASLRSVLDDSRDWHVNIINRRWVSEEDESDDEESDDDEEVPDEAREADVWPEIEGCTEEDVGWTKASKGILVGRYVDLCDQNYWYTYYTRPPQRAR